MPRALRLTQQDLILPLTRTGLSSTQARRVVSSVLYTIRQALLSGQSVELPELGTWSLHPTQARTGVRVSTGEPIFLPAGRKVLFQPSAQLRAALASPETEL